MDDTTRAELEAIRGRVEKATPGPWSVSENHFIIADHPGTAFHVICEIDCIGGRCEDENFIIHSRTDIPRLLSIIEEMADPFRDLLNSGWEVRARLSSGEAYVEIVRKEGDEMVSKHGEGATFSEALEDVRDRDRIHQEARDLLNTLK